MEIATTTVGDSPEPGSLGERIAEARDRTGLSVAQFARRLGVKTRTLSSWERGVSKPRSNRIAMLAGALNVTPAWLLSGKD